MSIDKRSSTPCAVASGDQAGAERFVAECPAWVVVV
jgi:hypothetical protein